MRRSRGRLSGNRESRAGPGIVLPAREAEGDAPKVGYKKTGYQKTGDQKTGYQKIG
jgi:hypothetical protein